MDFLSLEDLAEKLYPIVMKKFDEIFSAQCCIFLAATNLQEKATVRHAVSDTPEEAWSLALSALKEALDKKNITPTILRADWVVSSENVTWAECLVRVQSRRRNWFRQGIAFDKDYNFALTEQELNANLIFCNLEKEKLKGEFQADKAQAYFEIFNTEGAFVQDEMSEPLMIASEGISAGRRDFAKDDREIFLASAMNGAKYLVRQCKPNGKFIYGLYPYDDSVVPGYNTHRHFGTLYAMAEAYEACADDDDKKALGEAIERGLNYGIKDLLRYRKTGDGMDSAYFKEGTVTTIGISGLALLAFSKWTTVTGTKEYISLMRALARGIFATQKPDGHFIQALNIKDFSIRKEFIISFYDGEALFGLLRLYAITKDEEILDSVERAVNYFIGVNYAEKHDHWISYAMNELTFWKPEEKYFKFGLDNILPYLSKISKSTGHSPTQLEMIMAAENMIRRMKSLPSMKKLLKRVKAEEFYSAIDNRAERLQNGCFYPEVAMYFQNPARMLGGFFIRSEGFRVRIDDVQHTLSGLLAYDRCLKGLDTSPDDVKIENIPAEELLTAKVATKKENAGLPFLRVGILRKGNPSNWAPDSPQFTMFYTAKNFNIELLLFTPKDIDFKNKTVKATTLDGFKKIQKVVPLPRIIDNPASIFGGEFGTELRQLSKEYFFTRNPINSTKQKIYDVLLADGLFKDFLIDTITIENFEHFLTLLGQYNNDVILKPSGGNEGKGVARISFDGKIYHITVKNDKIIITTDKDLQKFYDEHFSQVKYVLQPYIVSRTRHGNPFDIRIHTRRGAEGKFRVSPYPRIGNENGVVSNVASGGYTMNLDVFLQIEFGNDWEQLYKRIMDLGNTFPEYYQSFFKTTLFDVGIDVGIQRRDKNYELKIFEVNTYCGGSFVRVTDAVTRFEYFHYVAQKLNIKETAPKKVEVQPKQEEPLLRVGVLRGTLNGSMRQFWNTHSPLYALFTMAKHFGIEMFYFTHKDIDFKKKLVRAATLKDGKKIECTIPLPRIIDNDTRAFNREENFIRPISGMGKQSFYNALSKEGSFNEYLIETNTVGDFENFLALFNQYHNDVILKPGNGVGGIGVARVTFDGKRYVINMKTEKFSIKTVEALEKFCKERFSRRAYLLQPYITSRTRNGNPFDIRIHARRGAGGKFKFFIYPRIGNANGVVSNIAAGGFSIEIEEFLQLEFGDDWKMLYDKLTDLGTRFPDYYQTFFKETIFDIGMDVGIQKRADGYDLKFFEVFTKPGTKVINTDAVITNFEYYHYIDQKLQDGSLK